MRKLLTALILMFAAGSATASCYNLTITDSVTKTPTSNEWVRYTAPEHFILCDVSSGNAVVKVLANGVTLDLYQPTSGIYSRLSNGSAMMFTLRHDGTLLYTSSDATSGQTISATGKWEISK